MKIKFKIKVDKFKLTLQIIEQKGNSITPLYLKYKEGRFTYLFSINSDEYFSIYTSSIFLLGKTDFFDKKSKVEINFFDKKGLFKFIKFLKNLDKLERVYHNNVMRTTVKLNIKSHFNILSMNSRRF